MKKERRQGEVGGYNHIQTHSLGLYRIYSSENAIFITIIKTQGSGHRIPPTWPWIIAALHFILVLNFENHQQTVLVLVSRVSVLNYRLYIQYFTPCSIFDSSDMLSPVEGDTCCFITLSAVPVHSAISCYIRILPNEILGNRHSPRCWGFPRRLL